jgi:hypothetical protein
VHHSCILGNGYKTLDEGDPVTFEIAPGDKGLKAQNVQRATPAQGFWVLSREGVFGEQIEAVTGAGGHALKDFPGGAPTASQHRTQQRRA